MNFFLHEVNFNTVKTDVPTTSETNPFRRPAFNLFSFARANFTGHIAQQSIFMTFLYSAKIIQLKFHCRSVTLFMKNSKWRHLFCKIFVPILGLKISALFYFPTYLPEVQKFVLNSFLHKCKSSET